MDRCYNERNQDYKEWGGRGIYVCDEWRDPVNGKRNFVEWAKTHGYAPGLSIDRENKGKYHKEQNGPYAPWNCRWIPKEMQAINRTTSHRVEIDGVTLTLKEWHEISEIPYSNLVYWASYNFPRLISEITGSSAYQSWLKSRES